MKKLICLTGCLFLLLSAYSQDSNYVRFKSDTALSGGLHYQQLSIPYYGNEPLTPHIYRDTRLGSSSPLYDSYKKNHYGAGAVTTNPNKWGSGSPVIFTPQEPVLDSSSVIHQPVERNMSKRDQ